MKTLIRFLTTEKEYLVYEENKEIKFMTTDEVITTEDKKLLFYILEKLVPSNKLLKLATFTNDDLEYKLYLDVKKNLYLFEPFNIDIVSLFNSTFNNEYDYVGNVLKQNKDYFRRIIKYNDMMVMVYVLNNISISLTSSIVSEAEDLVISIVEIENILKQTIEFNDSDIKYLKNDNKPKDNLKKVIDKLSLDDEIDSINQEWNIRSKKHEVEKEIDYAASIYEGKKLNNTLSFNLKELKTELDNATSKVKIKENTELEEYNTIYNQMFKALSNNKYLDRDEKESFLNLVSIVLDNKDMIDMDYYLDLLSKIEIKYCKNNLDTAGAIWNLNSSYIKFFNVTSPYELPPELLTNIYLHTLGKKGDSHNLFFNKVISVIFNNEYFELNNYLLYDNSYSNVIGLMYALIEIIGSDAIRNYNFNQDIKVIKDSLIDIIPNDMLAIALIEELNLLFLIYNSYIEWDFNNLREDIINIIRKYYEAKFNLSMDKDLLMLLYTASVDYQMLCKLYDFYPRDFNPYDYYKIKQNKYYINSNFKDSERVIFELIASDEEGRMIREAITITSDNRYIETFIK